MTTPRTAAGRELARSFEQPDEAFTNVVVRLAILAIEAEARAAYTDPQDRWRLVRVAPDVLAQWGARTEDGDRLTVEWGEPDDDGIYEPAFTRHGDDNLRAAALEPALALLAAVDDASVLALIEAEDGSEEPEWQTRLWDAADVARSAIDALRERSGE